MMPAPNISLFGHLGTDADIPYIAHVQPDLDISEFEDVAEAALQPEQASVATAILNAAGTHLYLS